MTDQLTRLSKQFVTLLLVMMQLFAPLAHGHFGADDLTSGFHFHLKMAPEYQKAEKLPFSSQAEKAGSYLPEVSVVEISTGIKKTIRVGHSSPSFAHSINHFSANVSRQEFFHFVITHRLFSRFLLKPPSRAPPIG